MTCEWNPKTNQHLEGGDTSHQEKAVWSLGGTGKNIHLCDSCSQLPDFKRYRKKTRLLNQSDWDRFNQFFHSYSHIENFKYMVDEFFVNQKKGLKILNSKNPLARLS